MRDIILQQKLKKKFLRQTPFNKIPILFRQLNSEKTEEFIVELSLQIANKENKLVPFFYSRYSTYYVCYDLNKVFFFNVYFNGEYKNFSFFLTNNSSTAIELADHPLFINSNKKYILLDFSMCYQEMNAIYLVWGIEFPLEKNFSLKSNIFIYKYELEKNNWSIISLKDEEKNDPINSRFNTSSCFLSTGRNKGEIWIFGGISFNGISKNSIDKVYYFKKF